MENMNSVVKLKKIALDYGVDGIVITEPSDLLYFSGYSNAEAIIYYENNKAYYITDSRYTEEVGNLIKENKEDLGDFELFEAGNYFNGLKEVSSKGLKIGFEEHIPFVDYINMKNATEFVSAVDVTNAICVMREVKTQKEIELIKKAAYCSDYALTEIFKEVKVGMTELEVQAKLEYYMIKAGAQGTSFDTIVAFGKGGSQPHHHSGNAVLKEGELVTIDCGANYFGYKSDITRTFAPSIVDEKKKKVYNIVCEANELGISLLKSGVKTGDVDKAVREFLKGYDLDGYFTHSLGHGVGLDIHESPYLRRNNDYVLKAGNIVTIEPGVYLPGEFGIRVEDLLLVTENGYEVLSHANKKLEIF